jgi:hypothetical protein
MFAIHNIKKVIKIRPNSPVDADDHNPALAGDIV